MNIHCVNEREQDGYTGYASQAGQDTDDRPGQYAGHEHGHMMRICKPLKRD